MKINLNNEIWIGIDVKRKKSREFQRMAITRSKSEFLEFSQYLIDSMPNTSRVVIIYTPTQHVIDFTGLIKTIGLKSKRYNMEA